MLANSAYERSDEVIYFDNSATTKVNEDVLQTYMQVSQNFWGNPSSLHDLGTKASSLLTQARAQIATLLNKKPAEILFTSGGTEGNNWILKSAAASRQAYGNHILVSAIEHPSVIESARQLQKQGYDVEFLPVTKEGFIDLAVLQQKLRKETILVSVMAVNNEIGTVQPLKQIAELLADYPTTYLHVDAVQAVGKLPVADYLLDRVDFATFSGHKFQAPRGTGFIYAKQGKTLEPLLAGGGQEQSFRSGTENLAGIAALSKAFRLTIEQSQTTISQLASYLTELRTFLAQFPKVHIFTPPTHVAPHILAFGIKGIRGEVLLHALEEHDIYVSTTSACSSHKKVKTGTLQAMQVPSQDSETVIRISLGTNNTIEEIKQFQQAFTTIYQKFDQLK